MALHMKDRWHFSLYRGRGHSSPGINWDPVVKGNALTAYATRAPIFQRFDWLRRHSIVHLTWLHLTSLDFTNRLKVLMSLVAMSKIHSLLDKYAKTWLFCLVGKLNSFLSPRTPGTTEIFENSHVQWQVSQKLFH